MKYAYIQAQNGDINFTCGANIIFWNELTQDEYEKQIQARKDGKIVFLDKNGKLTSRERHAKWDEDKQKWIIDKDSVLREKNSKIATLANSAYKKTDIGSHLYRKLTKSQQGELDNYLNDLLDIIKNHNTATVELALPDAPDFMG